MASSYLPHAIYSLAITSVSIHLVSQRKDIDAERGHLTARISILQSIVDQLRSERNAVSDEELARLKRLAGLHKANLPAEEDEKDDVSWKSVFFGRKSTEDPATAKRREREDLASRACIVYTWLHSSVS